MIRVNDPHHLKGQNYTNDKIALLNIYSITVWWKVQKFCSFFWFFILFFIFLSVIDSCDVTANLYPQFSEFIYVLFTIDIYYYYLFYFFFFIHRTMENRNEYTRIHVISSNNGLVSQEQREIFETNGFMVVRRLIKTKNFVGSIFKYV